MKAIAFIFLSLTTLSVWGQTQVIKRKPTASSSTTAKGKSNNSYTYKQFVVDSIEYHTESANEVLLYDVKRKVKGHFVIPEIINYQGKDYKVVAINNTLAGKKLLKEVTIPSTLKEMLYRPFGGDTALTTIHIAPGNTTFEIGGRGELINKITKTLMWVSPRLTGHYDVPSGTKAIKQGAFSDCKFSSITIPSIVETIGEWAFDDCKQLSKLVIPQNVKKTESSVFAGCEKLKEIVLPDDLKEIGYNSFACCWALHKLRIPRGLQKINKYAFWATRIIEFEVDLANPNYSAVNGMLCSKDGKTLVRYPTGGYWGSPKISISGISNIGEYAFYDCPIDSIAIPQSVTCIEQGAFRESHIKTIFIPNSVVKLGNCAFIGCNELKRVSIPSHLIDHLEESIFYGCKKLKEITVRYTDGTTKQVPIEEKWKKWAL